MENRFEPNPEQEGWGDYLKQPAPFGSHNEQAHEAEMRARRMQPQGLCLKVQEMLPHLLENDGTIRPEMAASVYGHLSVCPGCAREFDRQKQVIALMESLPPAELPMDFSSLIMQRIQTEIGPIYGSASFPAHAPSLNAAREALTAQQQQTARLDQAVQATQTTQTVTQTNQIHSTLTLWQRSLATTVLSAMLAFFLSTSWGRQMLNVNAQTATRWIEQIGETLARVPGLAWVVTLVGIAFSETGETLRETYQAMGTQAAYALALETAVGAIALALMAARRSRASLPNIQV